MSNMKLTLLICAISNYSITGFNVYLENHICLLRRKIIYFFTFYMFQNGVMDRLQNTYCRRFLIILQMWRCKFFFFLNVGNPSYYCIPGIDWTEKIRQTYIFFFYLSLSFSRLKLFSYLKGLFVIMTCWSPHLHPLLFNLVAYKLMFGWIPSSFMTFLQT